MTREFVITVMRKHNEIQENSKRQFSEVRKKINEQMKYFIKEIVIIKITNINYGAKKSLNEMRYALENIENRADDMEDRKSQRK